MSASTVKIITLVAAGLLVTAIILFSSFFLTRGNTAGFFGSAAILALALGTLVICGIIFGLLLGISSIAWYHIVWMLLTETVLVNLIFMILGGAPKDFGNILDVLSITAIFFLPSAGSAFVIVRGVRWLFGKYG